MNKLEERFNVKLSQAMSEASINGIAEIKLKVAQELCAREAKDIAIEFARMYYYEMMNLGGLGIYPDLNDDMVFNKFIENKYGKAN